NVLRYAHAQRGSEPSADDAQAEPVAEEYPHHAAVGSAERFQDADVASLFHDNHEENGQDTEPGDGDDQEKQHIEDAAFDANGGQNGALLLFPRLNDVIGRIEVRLEDVDDLLRIAVVVFQLDE